MWIRILKAWLKWRKDWDSLCNRCGKCCYTRSVWAKGRVSIHFDDPCENLDEETHLCRIYEDRFRKCNHCGKVNLFTALFNPTLPNDCAYRRTFRLWDKE
ncbi:MAG: hypothetical protein LUC90_05050 [Lachnospiraceae bacterium]|nr:hypothetical protein [Lachnospiraceae bacterium]